MNTDSRSPTVSHGLAALAGCAAVLGLVALALLPMRAPRGSEWLTVVGWFLPFPILTVPALWWAGRRRPASRKSSVLIAAVVAAGLGMVLELANVPPDYSLSTVSGWIGLLVGAAFCALVGSIAGLVFWEIVRPRKRNLPSEGASSQPPGRSARHWLESSALAVYFFVLAVIVAVVIYGAGHALLGWPSILGLWPAVY